MSGGVDARRPRWRRIIWPTSYWPCKWSRTTWFWHPWHIGAAFSRLRFRYLKWKGY